MQTKVSPREKIVKTFAFFIQKLLLSDEMNGGSVFHPSGVEVCVSIWRLTLALPEGKFLLMASIINTCPIFFPKVHKQEPFKTLKALLNQQKKTARKRIRIWNFMTVISHSFSPSAEGLWFISVRRIKTFKSFSSQIKRTARDRNLRDGNEFCCSAYRIHFNKKLALHLLPLP